MLNVYKKLINGCIIFSVDGNKKSIIVIRQRWNNCYQRYYFTGHKKILLETVLPIVTKEKNKS